MKNPIKNNLIIELHVPDFEIAKEFYSKLGFEVSIEDKPNELSGYLTMIRKDDLGETLLNFYGGNEIVYNQSFFKQFPKETIRGYAVSITIPVRDIISFYDSVKENLNKSINRGLKEIEDQGVTWKDFRIVDPFGYYLRFIELIDWGQA